MPKSQDVQNRRIQRAARPPAEGNSISGATGGNLLPASKQSDAVVYDDGSVRRLWIPGDPWDSNFYFGSGELI